MISHPPHYRLFAEATRLAAQFHDGQTRKDGSPYILHPLRVAGMATHLVAKLVAIFHDAIEDAKDPDKARQVIKTFLTEELNDQGEADEVFNAIEALTAPKIEGSRRERKIAQFENVLKGGSLAVQVKVLDRLDNLSELSLVDPDFASLYVEESELLYQTLATSLDYYSLNELKNILRATIDELRKQFPQKSPECFKQVLWQ